MNKALLNELCCSFGVSGREKTVADRIADRICADEIKRDGAGNLICIKKSKNPDAPYVMVDAHMDSVGLCVSEICEGGFLKFSAVGGIDCRILPGTLVEIHAKEKTVVGVIATKPPHLMDKNDALQSVPHDKLLIDTANNAEDIQVGDRVRYYPFFEVLLDKAVSATYLDNRAGCSILTELFDSVKDTDLPFHLCGVFSTGEESGMKGATYGMELHAAVGIAIDATFGESPLNGGDMTFPCGSGVAIGVGPNIHKKMQKSLTLCAQKNHVRHRFEILEGSSGTNAWSYQVKNNGIPMGLLSFPVKYMHTPTELLHIADYDATLSLLSCWIQSLTEQEILEIAGDEIC